MCSCELILRRTSHSAGNNSTARPQILSALRQPKRYHRRYCRENRSNPCQQMRCFTRHCGSCADLYTSRTRSPHAQQRPATTRRQNPRRRRSRLSARSPIRRQDGFQRTLTRSSKFAARATGSTNRVSATAAKGRALGVAKIGTLFTHPTRPDDAQNGRI